MPDLPFCRWDPTYPPWAEAVTGGLQLSVVEGLNAAVGENKAIHQGSCIGPGL